jgi:uncharacterized protein (TIGR03067 family)
MIRQFCWLALVLLVALKSAATVRGDDAGDLKKMQGSWSFTNDQGEEKRWVFEGETLKSMVGAGLYVSKVKLDSKAQPVPAIDLMITEAPDDSAGMTALAIYKLDGDKLTLCISHPGSTTRPTEFKRVEAEVYLIELKRAK